MTSSHSAPSCPGLDILFIAPHPDDVELFCGGTVAYLASQGYRVGIAELSAGELSSQGSVTERRAEMTAAAKLLGLRSRLMLGFPDGGIDSRPSAAPDSQVLRLVGCIRAVRPRFVVAPYWNERHPDHVETSRLVTRAVFLAALPKVSSGVPNFECLYDCEDGAKGPGNSSGSVSANEPAGAHFRVSQIWYYPMRVHAPVSFVVDVTGSYAAKQQAIALFGSQVVRRSADLPTLVSSPLNAAALEARDIQFGSLIGVRYGEGFVLRSPVPIGDPIAFFDGTSVSGALFFPEEM